MQTAQQLELFFQCTPVVSTNADGSLTVRPGRVRRMGGVKLIGVDDCRRMAPHLTRRTVQRYMVKAGAGQDARGGKRWIAPDAWQNYLAARGLTA